jgi:hypothetical protein
VEHILDIEHKAMHSFETCQKFEISINGKKASFEMDSLTSQKLIQFINQTNKYFAVEGYWKDSEEEFSEYIVSEMENVPLHEQPDNLDDEIWFYGLSQTDIINLIQQGENSEHDFVITSYRILN